MRTHTHSLEVVVNEKLKSLTCNKCGSSTRSDDSGKFLDYTLSEFHNIVLSGGYGSTYPSDREHISFDVCSTCLEDWVKSFKHPPLPNNTFSLTQYQATHTETGEVLTGDVTYIQRTDAEDKHKLNEDSLQFLPLLGVWEHFKGGMYKVLNVVWDPRDGAWIVIYVSLDGKTDTTWARPLSMWQERIQRDGYDGPRFKYIRDAMADT
jgi:hypothetical protein